MTITINGSIILQLKDITVKLTKLLNFNFHVKMESTKQNSSQIILINE